MLREPMPRTLRIDWWSSRGQQPASVHPHTDRAHDVEWLARIELSIAE